MRATGHKLQGGQPVVRPFLCRRLRAAGRRPLLGRRDASDITKALLRSFTELRDAAVQDVASLSAEKEKSVSETPEHNRARAQLLARELSELHVTLAALVRDTATLAASRNNDAEASSDLLHSVSRDMWRAPDLRVAWLLNLADYQEAAHAYEEAAQTKIAVAVLVAEVICFLF